MRQSKDLLLHRFTKHTNLSVPFSKYITPQTFPKQNTNLLGNYAHIQFRDMYNTGEGITDLNIHFSDLPDFKVDNSELADMLLNKDKSVSVKICRVLRCDMEEPYRMICISTDFMYMFVTDSRCYFNKVVQYPIQFNEYIGIRCFNQYPGIIPEIQAYTLRVDDGEPCYSILVEYMEDDTVRFLLGDEAFSRLYDPYNSPDYDGRDSVDYNETYKDLDGGKVDLTPQDALFFAIDGGRAEILKPFCNTFKSREDIAKIRKEILGGKYLYGADQARASL